VTWVAESDLVFAVTKCCRYEKVPFARTAGARRSRAVRVREELHINEEFIDQFTASAGRPQKGSFDYPIQNARYCDKSRQPTILNRNKGFFDSPGQGRVPRD
jgi:hypothetical protein